MKKNTLFLKRLGLLAILLLFQYSFSQNATLYGVVSDAKGNPIPAVNVTIANTSKGTSTDADGKYSFSNLADETVEVVALLKLTPVFCEVDKDSFTIKVDEIEQLITK